MRKTSELLSPLHRGGAVNFVHLPYSVSLALSVCGAVINWYKGLLWKILAVLVSFVLTGVGIVFCSGIVASYWAQHAHTVLAVMFDILVGFSASSSWLFTVYITHRNRQQYAVIPARSIPRVQRLFFANCSFLLVTFVSWLVFVSLGYMETKLTAQWVFPILLLPHFAATVLLGITCENFMALITSFPELVRTGVLCSVKEVTEHYISIETQISRSSRQWAVYLVITLFLNTVLIVTLIFEMLTPAFLNRLDHGKYWAAYFATVHAWILLALLWPIAQLNGVASSLSRVTNRLLLGVQPEQNQIDKNIRFAACALAASPLHFTIAGFILRESLVWTSLFSIIFSQGVAILRFLVN